MARDEGSRFGDTRTLGGFLDTLSPEQMELYRDAQKVWPIEGVASQMPEEGRGSVWIGPKLAAWPVALARRGITHVVCLTQDGPMAGTSGEVLHLPMDDEPGEDLLRHLDRAVGWISDAVALGGHVLVHCQAGRSRSASVVAAFLVRSEGCSLDAAIEFVNAARPFVGINDGFMKQLHEYCAPLQACKPGCELCLLEKTTPWLQEAEQFTVLLCDQCDNPMCVWKRHTMLLSRRERAAMQAALAAHADKEFGGDDWYLDTQQRTIYDHCHWHARPHTAMSRMIQKLREQQKAKDTGDSAKL